MSIGDPIEIPGHGEGVVAGWRGKIIGLRTWLYVIVRFTDGRAIIHPLREGAVLQ